ncbi:MAG: hypothetical protein C0601_13545 [Candidatus Muiribacterium halophilum]|uniref:Phosphoglucomutase n=1 Tax=Muiribacterium halophilum TaxID=2053465 RepID=A0A2N5Z989_MUIH1|nr:MAG: hypothetical protein C0601_13545 [Candidatus Muirbacterium halophilum]
MKFSRGGWTGIISDDFTFEKASIVIKAICKYMTSHGLDRKKLIVSYDSRFLSYKYAQLAVEVITGHGIKCIISERDIPSVFSLSTLKNDKEGGVIHFSGSNREYYINSILFFPEYGGPAFSHIVMEIERNIRLISQMEEDIPMKSYGQGLALSNVIVHDIFNDYKKILDKSLDMKKIKEVQGKICVDYMNGSLRGFLRDILPKGINLIEINSDYNPYMGGHRPDPESGNHEFLSETIKNSESDFGVAFDTDAQHVAFFDSHGRKVNSNILLGVILDYLIRNRSKSGKVVKTLSSTSLIDIICEENAIEVIETFTGFKHVSEKLLKEKIIFAVDSYGGITFSGHLNNMDSILLLMMIIEIIGSTEKSFEELINDCITKYGDFQYKREKIGLSGEDEKLRIIGKLKLIAGEFDGSKIKEIKQSDGFKIIFENGSWLLLRMDPVNPELELFYESKYKDFIEEVQKKIKRFLGD